jgi:hypothetical protein
MGKTSQINQKSKRAKEKSRREKPGTRRASIFYKRKINDYK